MATLEERLERLEASVEALHDWRRQIDTLITIVVGAAEPIIDADDDMR